MCPETAAPLPSGGCGGPLYLLSCIKPLDALTSSAERLQSKLVQTFPRAIAVILCLDDILFSPESLRRSIRLGFLFRLEGLRIEPLELAQQMW